ncbi:MAG TPA: LysR substrate-binding domain-containing protein [Chthoniobacterales bacterium]
MELRHLKSFVAVAEELNFSKAALRLHVAQSALSRTIRDLENELGFRLLERDSHGVRLTDPGSVFLERTRRILSDTQDAITISQCRARGETGTLRLGFIGTLSHSILPRVLQASHAQWPGIDLHLHEMHPTAQRAAILDGRLDAGLIGLIASQEDPDLEFATAAQESLFAAVPMSHPLANRASVALPELHGESFYFTAREDAPLFNPWVFSLCRAADFEPRVVKETDRSATVLNYIAAGFGISIFPAQLAALATPGVCWIPFDPPLPLYTYSLAWKRGHQTPAVARFLDLIRKG